MNKFIYTIVVAQGLDENGHALNIMQVVYCHDKETAEQIAEFIFEARGKRCVCILQALPISTFEDVFKQYMNLSFGKDQNENIVN